MANQPKAKPLSESDFFSNQANARPIPPHTVERGGARENAAFYTGLTDRTYITQLPVNLTPELLARGRERFDVITNGYGVMYSYATRVEPEDRWAIAAYIRALQLSHNVKASELTPTEQQKLENEQ